MSLSKLPSIRVVFILVAAEGLCIPIRHINVPRWAPFQIATVSLRYTCKTCFFVGPWGPYRPLLTKIKTGINPV